MTILRHPYMLLLYLFVIFYLDTTLTRLFNTLLDLPLYVSSHLWLVALVYFLDILPYTILLFSALLLGIGYDIYFLDFYPIMLLILPLVVYLARLLSHSLLSTILSRFLLVIVLVFVWEMGTYGLAYLYGITTYHFLSFIIGILAPTLIFVMIEFFLIMPLLEKIKGAMT